MRVLTGVDGVLSVAHRAPDGGPLHGHSYLVRAWLDRPGEDAEDLKRELHAVLHRWDHGVLPDAVTRAEALAPLILTALPGCVELLISRPLEGLHVKVTT